MATAKQRQAFAHALQQARDDCGLSQRDLADALGIAQASVSHWLLGRSAPRSDRVAQLEHVLRLEPGTLAGLLGQDDSDHAARPVTVPEAAAADPRLGERERRILVAVYRELVQQTAVHDGQPAPS